MQWSRSWVKLLILFCLFVTTLLSAQSNQHAKASDKVPSSHAWTFAVAGDSRNCGDVIMPTIANSATDDHAAFYWHLGDLRKISAPDEDFRQLKIVEGKSFTINDYENEAWDNFIQNQIASFGTMPFFSESATMKLFLRKRGRSSSSNFPSGWMLLK